LDSSQWLAQQFTLNNAYSVSSVQGWMGAYVPGLVTLVVYTDQSSSPGVELFSSVFSVQDRLNSWNGVQDMSLQLNAGTYWAAFEVGDIDGMRGYMGGDALYQVGSFAYGHGNSWATQSNQGLGLRVEGDAFVVPVAPTVNLVLIGLLAVFVVVRPKVVFRARDV